jgi:hypothetical protein
MVLAVTSDKVEFYLISLAKKALVGSIGQCNSYPNRMNCSGDQNETNIFTARERP